MSGLIVMGLKVKVDSREFNRVLTEYAEYSKLTVEQAVAKKFRSVVFEARKLQLATRPDTLARIASVKASGELGISERTMARLLKRRSKLAQQVERMNKAIAKGGKRGQKAAMKLLSATTQLQRNAGQEAWDAEVKMRENAAGRAGAWGWRIKGSTFNDIATGDRSAKVSKASDFIRTFIEIANNRPMSSEFADRKGILSGAMSNVLADMKQYLERQLSKL
jgi:hypothetical protein